MKTIFWCDLHKKGLHVFFCKVVQHFLKTNNVGRHFCPDFYGFGPDFQQIKTLGGPLAPLPPTPLRSHPPPPLSTINLPAGPGPLPRLPHRGAEGAAGPTRLWPAVDQQARDPVFDQSPRRVQVQRWSRGVAHSFTSSQSSTVWPAPRSSQWTCLIPKRLIILQRVLLIEATQY